MPRTEEHREHTEVAQLLREHAERWQAKARADAAATELLAEEAAEKAAVKKSNGKERFEKKKAMAAPFAAAVDPVAAVPLAGASKPVVAEEELPALAGADVSLHRPLLRGWRMAAAWSHAGQSMMRWLRHCWWLPSLGKAAACIAQFAGAAPLAGAAPFAGAPKPAAAQEKLPDEPSCQP